MLIASYFIITWMLPEAGPSQGLNTRAQEFSSPFWIALWLAVGLLPNAAVRVPNQYGLLLNSRLPVLLPIL